MASNRKGRINEEVQRELSTMLMSVKDPRVQGLVSVTGVEVTGDMRHAKVYISALNKDEKELLKGLKSASGYLRRELGARLNLRNTPELHFEMDGSIEHGAHIMKILNSLNIPDEVDEGGETTDGEDE